MSRDGAARGRPKKCLTDAGITPELVRACLPVPAGVGVRTAVDGRPALPWPEEESALNPRAVARRRLHFGLGRAAAREALADLGVAPEPIPKGERGQPLWPPGVRGSITHSGDVAVAAVVRDRHARGLGIDLEAVEPGVSREAGRLVGSPDELAWTGDCPEDETACLRRTLLFAAKEAVFKAVYPVGGVALGFHDAELVWTGDGFRAVLLRAGGAGLPAGYRLEVACRVLGPAVFAATALPPHRSA